MGDFIDREQVLKTIYNRYGSAYEWYLENGVSGKELDFALTSYAECHVAIRNLPSAESTEPKWIPMTERLPEDKQRVIVQMSNGHIDIINFNVYGLTEHLIAWMPLPEPWKGEENDK